MGQLELKEFYRGRRILITGHNGFKGSWMCRILDLLGAEVTGYALQPPTTPSLFGNCSWPERFRFLHGDVRDLERMQAAFDESRPEVVFHMAAQPLVRESYQEPVYTFDVNVMGSVNLMECVRRSESVCSVVNVTTDKVYRNDDRGQHFRESDRLGGHDPYAASKACSEIVTEAYARSFLRERGTAVSTVRAGNVIGGGDFAADRILPDCFRAAVAGKAAVIRNPLSVRPFEHVLEPLYAYLKLAMFQYEDPSLAGSYNVGPDEQGCSTVEELVRSFSESWERFTGKKLDWIVQGDGGPHESAVLMLDCTKIRERLGIVPVWPVRQAVEKAAEWYAAFAEGKDPGKCMIRQIEEYYEKQVQR